MDINKCLKILIFRWILLKGYILLSISQWVEKHLNVEIENFSKNSEYDLEFFLHVKKLVFYE